MITQLFVPNLDNGLFVGTVSFSFVVQLQYGIDFSAEKATGTPGALGFLMPTTWKAATEDLGTGCQTSWLPVAEPFTLCWGTMLALFLHPKAPQCTQSQACWTGALHMPGISVARDGVKRSATHVAAIAQRSGPPLRIVHSALLVNLQARKVSDMC